MTFDGDRYQQRFDELAAAGKDVHGEADFVMSFAPGSVLDAGCGTGRVARELAARGVEVTGVDPDPSMLETARRLGPELQWVESTMEDLELDRNFDVVVVAGNVPLFVASSRRRDLVAGCARHLARSGVLIAGFQLGPGDRSRSGITVPIPGLRGATGYDIGEYDADCEAAGLVLSQRWATWERDPYPGEGTYAVSVHQRI